MIYKDFLASSERDCAVVVHRGLWTEAPENSLLAIDEAIQAGFPVVEVDVRKTADGHFVLLHDHTFERTAGHDFGPETMTLDEINALRLRDRDGGSGNAVTGEKVPTLDELFALTRGRIFVHLDVKQREIIPEALERVERAGVKREVDFWNNLRTQADLDWFKQVFDGHDVVVMPKTRLNAPDAAFQMELALAFKPVVCEFVYDSLADILAVRETFEAAGIATWCNTLDGVACGGHKDSVALDKPKDVWAPLLDAGVSVIQTDEAHMLRSFINSRLAR